MADLSSLTADQLAETVRELDSYDITVPGYEDALAALAELLGRLKTAEDALAEIATAKVPKTYGGGWYGAQQRARAALAAIRPNPKPLADLAAEDKT